MGDKTKEDKIAENNRKEDKTEEEKKEVHKLEDTRICMNYTELYRRADNLIDIDKTGEGQGGRHILMDKTDVNEIADRQVPKDMTLEDRIW